MTEGELDDLLGFRSGFTHDHQQEIAIFEDVTLLNAVISLGSSIERVQIEASATGFYCEDLVGFCYRKIQYADLARNDPVSLQALHTPLDRRSRQPYKLSQRPLRNRGVALKGFKDHQISVVEINNVANRHRSPELRL